MSQQVPSRALAVIACFFFGMLGIHNFYLGRNGTGATQLCIFVLSVLLFPLGAIGLLVLAIWCLIDLFAIAFKSESAWRAEFGQQHVIANQYQQPNSFMCQCCGNIVEMPPQIFARMIGEYTTCPYCQQDVEVRYTPQRGY